MNVRLSVIIPLYNTEAYVGEALSSLAAQTFGDWEAIVVDDGSTDRGAEVVEDYVRRDGRFRLLRQANAGQSAARNRALEVARGRYVYFMDSDDAIRPDTLARCVERCERDRLDFVLFDAESFDEKGPCTQTQTWLDYRRAAILGDGVYDGAQALSELLAARRYRCSVCLNVVRRDLIEGAGLRFCEGIIHEDELFSAQLYLSARRVGAIAADFYLRRVRAASTMTTAFSERNVAGYTTVFERLDAWSAGLDAGRRRLVVRLEDYMLPVVLRRSWELPFAVRRRLASLSLRRWRHSVDARSLACLLLKKPLKRLAGR